MSQEFAATGPLAEVDCHGTDGRWTLVFVRELGHPPEKVWSALTDPEQLRRWAPYTADRNLASTGDATLTMVDGDSSETLPGAVTRAEPPTLLEHAWGDDTLRWELEPSDRGTRLTLSQTTADKSFITRNAAGWHLCFVVAERLLDGHPVEPVTGEAALDHGWEQLHEAYAAELDLDPTG